MRPSIAPWGLRTKQVSHGQCRVGHMQLHPDLRDSNALYGPSPARSPLPGLQPEAFRHRCIKQVFIGFYWQLGVVVDYSALMDPVLHNALNPGPLPYDFTVLLTKESAYISPALDIRFSCMSCLGQRNVGLHYVTRSLQSGYSILLALFSFAITMRTQPGKSAGPRRR